MDGQTSTPYPGGMTLAVDLGTTTIALRPVCADAAFPTIHLENPQRLFGADVISRMHNAHRQHLGGRLRDMVRRAIVDAAEAGGIPWPALSGVVLAGNTLMTHLFCGWDVAGMLAAPFTPHSLSMHRKEWDAIPVTLFPGISAFVGGDIVAGCYALDLDTVTAPTLFADLGTNGELVLALPECLLVTSVAAGPAFEGGNISIGMAAVDGAIHAVSIHKGFCRIATIADALPPKGLCGSGLFDAVCALREDGLIDEYGSFVTASYRTGGFPLYLQPPSFGASASARNPRYTAPDGHRGLYLTADDLRHFLMAKAAVAAGIESLLAAASLAVTDVDRLYLAGSFGIHLDITKAAAIGLIPTALSDRTTVVGNTSLDGAARLAAHPSDTARVRAIADMARSLSLADSEHFKEAYIRHMTLNAT